MKKSLLALAVLGAFAGVASAQSSVTIYGLIDESVTKSNGGATVNPAGAATNTAGSLTTKSWQVRDNSSGSRFGLRGNEDLGGGWSAQFLIEHRFNPDTGVQNNTAGNIFWQGGSYVQLTNAAAGSVYLGRWYTPTFWINFKSDPFAYAGIASTNTFGLGNFLTQTPQGPGVRSANTVGYKTPNWGGFTANVAVAPGEGTVGRDDAINFEYAGGPLWTGAAYERTKDGPAANAGNKVANFGIAYDFKFIRPILYVAKSETGVNNALEGKVISAALTSPIGAGVLKAAYTQRKNSGTNVIKVQKIGLGYDYFLSKRTRVYVDYAQAKQSDPDLSTNRAYAVGVRHEF